jgi:hypothetical protein
LTHKRTIVGEHFEPERSSRRNHENQFQIYDELSPSSFGNPGAAILFAGHGCMCPRVGRCVVFRSLVCFLFALASLFGVTAAAQSFEEANVQRWGADYAQLTMKNGTAATCASACAKDERCQAWSFARPGVEGRHGACHLKGAVPHGSSDPCCVSGVAGGSSLAAAAEPALSQASAGPPTTKLTPTGMTASIGAPRVAAAPALSPLAPAVTDRATAPPFGLRPASWREER